MLELLEDQLRRRRQGEPPAPRPASEWCVEVEDVDEERERAHCAVLTIADGCIGTTGASILPTPASAAQTLVAGFYDGEGADEHLRPCPAWNQLTVPLGGTARLSRVLDLRTGVLAQVVKDGSAVLSGITFSSLADPGTGVLWASGDAALVGSIEPQATQSVVNASPGGAVTRYLTDDRLDGDNGAVVERIAVFARGEGTAARHRVQAARARGLHAVHRAHREAWAARWRNADIQLDGDTELQRCLRLALFHLTSAVGAGDEFALGARGLSGDGYRGHVFWDLDVFVLPFLAASRPAAARAMLGYRVHRIGAALERARELGLEGAKFPWESASSGREVTPATVVGPRGEIVRVRTGEMEDHIVADVAWAACRYVDWTADDTFGRGPLTRLLVETARYWASRIESDADGSAHIRGVIGPDEYHEGVDDNAFTNVLARWNLRAAVTRTAGQCDDQEVRRWAALADNLVDGLDESTLVYEQFAGFSQLAPFPLRDTYGPAPFAAELGDGIRPHPVAPGRETGRRPDAPPDGSRLGGTGIAATQP